MGDGGDAGLTEYLVVVLLPALVVARTQRESFAAYENVVATAAETALHRRAERHRRAEGQSVP